MKSEMIRIVISTENEKETTKISKLIIFKTKGLGK